MRRLVLVLLVLLVAVAAAGGLAWQHIRAFRDAPFGDVVEKVVEIPPGASARAAVRILAGAKVLSDERTAWWYVRWVRRDARPLRAGEYAFAGTLRPDEVLDRLARGEVRLHRFMVPEGLRADEIAPIVERSGLARAADFLAVARDPSVAKAAALPYPGLEGFLYPDTYSFAKGVSPLEIVQAMVRRFEEEYALAALERAPGIEIDPRQITTLASIIEKETGRAEERGRISCVFHNRLRRGMRLQADPTVMYARMLRTGTWSRNISREDLSTPHPYNTYTNAGLPPGPIANPGGASLRAALHPEKCDDLFFVSRNDGSHVFCPDLACHNAAVKAWQVDFFRRTRAAAP